MASLMAILMDIHEEFLMEFHCIWDIKLDA